MDVTKVLKYILPCFFGFHFEFLTALIFYVKHFTFTVLIQIINFNSFVGVSEKISMRANAYDCFVKGTRVTFVGCQWTMCQVSVIGLKTFCLHVWVDNSHGDIMFDWFVMR